MYHQGTAQPYLGRDIACTWQTGEAAILAINPLLRRVNDRLFQNISREDFAIVSRFLATFALNSEYALAEIRRSELERASQDRLQRIEDK